MEIKIHRAYNCPEGVIIRAIIPLPYEGSFDLNKEDAQKLADALEWLPRATVDYALEILLSRIEEAKQSRLDDVGTRLQEMDYALVAGNIAQSDIPFRDVRWWIHYVFTGNDMHSEDEFLSVAELDADSDGYPGGF